MTDQELLSTLENIKGLAVKAGKIQIENLGRSDLEIITKSSSIDLVTEVDKKSEKCILQFIGENYPSHSVLAEESGISSGQSDYLWVVDPLDGTTNYSQGLPIFSVSIALQYKKETVLGIVYAPVLRQMFTAVKGHGAYLNGSQIHVSAKKELSASVLATGFPYDRVSHPVNNLNYFSALARKTRGVRRFGSAAYDLASVAVGHFDGYWEMNLSPWDVCAGILLVQEAGGEIIFFREDRKISLIAGNKNICRAIQTEIIHTDQTAAK
ncbi:MAG: inositol monophosphatase family protein [Veillonellales bacterium]